MNISPSAKAGILALFLTLAFLTGWELYWRRQGFELSYNDDEPLWAYHHRRIYNPSVPVIIGSSRGKFNFDLATWESITGEAPVQLAQVGTSPRPILADLAADEQFRGTVIVDVTEGLYFSPSGSPPEKQSRAVVKFYPDWSLAQQGSFYLNKALESRLLFLDERELALRNLMNRAPIPPRPGVMDLPPFPLKFVRNNFNRQTSLTEAFMSDTAKVNRMRSIWVGLGTMARRMPLSDSALAVIMNQTKAAVDQIRARGGRVLFVRMPSSGALLEMEKKLLPRDKYWERLLRHTGAPGIHYADYPELAQYQCPEWSHLSPQDAKTFTRDFIRIMGQQTGWINTLPPSVSANLSTPR